MRRIYAVSAALFWTAGVYYASLLPLKYRYIPWDQAVERFQHTRWLHLGLDSRQDLVANGLLFILVGFLWAAAFCGPKRTVADLLGWLLAIIISAAAALAIEFTQVYFPNRTVSWNDVASEIIGGTFGVFLWATTGRRIWHWLATLWDAHGQEFIARLLATYSFLILLFALMPCDLVLNWTELAEKWHRGRVTVWGDPNLSTFTRVAHLCLLGLAFVPVGAYCRLRASASSAISILRPWPARALAFALASELLQLVVYTRYFSLIDIAAGFAGALAGGLTIDQHAILRFVKFVQSRSIALWVSSAVAYSVLLCWVFWYPFEWETNPVKWQTGWQGLVRPPFAAHYAGTEFNALSNVLFRFGSFAVLGLLEGLIVWKSRREESSVAFQFGLLYAFLLGLVIETVQIGLAGRTCDITDVIVGTLGAVFGQLVVLRSMMMA